MDMDMDMDTCTEEAKVVKVKSEPEDVPVLADSSVCEDEGDEGAQPEQREFSRTLVYTGMRTILKEYFRGKTYSKDEVNGWLQDVTKAITEKVHTFKFYRYKFVVNVIITEITRNEDGTIADNMCSLSNFLWDSETDKFTMYTFFNVSFSLMKDLLNILENILSPIGNPSSELIFLIRKPFIARQQCVASTNTDIVNMHNYDMHDLKEIKFVELESFHSSLLVCFNMIAKLLYG